MSKGKILWWGDSPTACTGFGNAAREILTRLHATGKYEICVVGINYLPHHKNDFDFQIIPADFRQDPFGVSALPKEAAKFKPDVVFCFHDIFNIERVIRGLRRARPTARIIGYFPIDGSPLHHSAVETMNKLDCCITYTQFARRTIIDAGYEPEIAVIGHGCSPEIYHPVSEEERMAFRRDRLGWADDIFGVVSVNMFQPRKNVPGTIEAFNRFSCGYWTCDICGHYNNLNADQHFDGNVWVDRCELCDIDSELNGGKNIVQPKKNVAMYLHMPTQHRSMGPAPIHSLESFIDACGPWSSQNSNILLPPPGTEVLEDPPETVNLIYNAGDLFVTNTIGEGWGMTIQEALMAGTPVVAPNHTSIPEITAGCARLVPSATRLRFGFDSTQSRPIPSMRCTVASMDTEYWGWFANGKKKNMVTGYTPPETWDGAAEKFDKLISEQMDNRVKWETFAKKRDEVCVIRWMSGSVSEILQSTPVFDALRQKFRSVRLELPENCRSFMGRSFELIEGGYEQGPDDTVYDLDANNPWLTAVKSAQDGIIGQSVTDVMAQAFGVVPRTYVPIFERHPEAPMVRKIADDGITRVGIGACSMPQHDWMDAIRFIRLLLNHPDKYRPIIISTDEVKDVGVFHDVTVWDNFPVDAAIGAVAYVDVLVTTDSFLIDAANIFNVPTLAIMGPSGARERLKHTRAQSIFLQRPCMPCWRSANQVCHVNDGDPNVSLCLTDIKAKMVFDEFEKMLVM